MRKTDKGRGRERERNSSGERKNREEGEKEAREAREGKKSMRKTEKGRGRKRAKWPDHVCVLWGRKREREIQMAYSALMHLIPADSVL